MFAVCEPGCGENVFVWLAAGWFELIRLLLRVRFALGVRFDVLLLLGEVAGRVAARLFVERFPAKRFSAARFPAVPDVRACLGEIAGAW